MNLNQLATGLLSGYIFKAIQLAASIVLVPFLLDSDVLGVDDYGRAFAILGITGLFSIATVGLHYATDRAIAHAVAEERPGSPDVRDLVGSAIKVHSIVSLTCVVPFILFDTQVLTWIGIPADSSYRGAVFAAGVISLLENSLYPIRAPLIARGEIAFVNLIGMLELTGRTIAVFLVFTLSTGTIATLLGLQAVFTLARQFAYFARLRRTDRQGILRVPLSRALETVRYAGPVSLTEGSTLLIRNVPVILASRFLGPIEAGYVAIVANTLQGYILQIFLAVFQPIAVPIASRIRLSELSPSKRNRFLQLEAAYGLGIAVAFSQAIIWTPTFIPLWLGDEFENIVFATQVMIAGCGIQTSTLIRRSILIGHGALPQAAPVIAGSALIASLLTAIGIAAFHSWIAAIVIGTAHMIVSSSLGIDRVFSRFFRDGAARIRLPHVASVTFVFVIAWLIGEQMSQTSIVGDLVTATIGVATTIAVGSLTIISLREVYDLADALYRSRGIDLFD